MIGMAAIARPMVLALIGQKWEPCIIYLQLLCFAGMLYPLHAINLNLLQIKGRSDLFLILEIVKKALAIPIVIIGIFWGIKAMIIGMIINSFIAFYLNSFWSGRFIGYPVLEQIKDILPSFVIALLMGIIVYCEGILLDIKPISMLIVQLLTGALVFIVVCESIRFGDYLYIKTIIKDNFIKRFQS